MKNINSTSSTNQNQYPRDDTPNSDYSSMLLQEVLEDNPDLATAIQSAKDDNYGQTQQQS